MILLSGKGATSSTLPIDPDRARRYFQDLHAFLEKIEAVSHVKPLARPHTYLVTHHPVGGLQYKVVVVSCLQAEWHAGGMHLRPLDFDTAGIKAEFPIVKGFTEGELKLAPHREEGTVVDFAFTVSIELPLEGVLKILPRALIKTTADGIITYQTGQTVKSLFRKVLEDFAPGGAGFAERPDSAAG